MFVVVVCIYAAVAQIVISLLEWLSARWFSVDRQIGKHCRALLISEGRRLRTGGLRLWGRRTAIRSTRALASQLTRAGCRADSAATLITALRAKEDLRPAVRAISLGYIRGDLLEADFELPVPRPAGFGELVPGWAAAIALFVSAVGLINGMAGLFTRG